MLTLDRPPQDLLTAFLNTMDVDVPSDAMATEETWAAWLTEQQIPGDLAPLEPCRDLRDELRTWVLGQGPVGLSLDFGLTLRGRDRPGTQATLQASDLPGLVGAALARLEIENRLDRLKICPADDCEWAFYDESRNHSRTWCSMEVCGNRAKVRAHKARQRPQGRGRS